MDVQKITLGPLRAHLKKPDSGKNTKSVQRRIDLTSPPHKSPVFAAPLTGVGSLPIPSKKPVRILAGYVWYGDSERIDNL